MRLVAYPNCCGKTILNNLGNNPDDLNPDRDHPVLANETQRQALDRIMENRQRSNPRASYEVVINATQNRLWGPILVEKGFRLVATHVNPVHNSTIYTYYSSTDLVLFGEPVELTDEQVAIQARVTAEAQVAAQAQAEQRAIAERTNREQLAIRNLFGNPPRPMSYDINDYERGEQHLPGGLPPVGQIVVVNSPGLASHGQIGRVTWSGIDTCDVQLINGRRSFRHDRLQPLTRRAPAELPRDNQLLNRILELAARQGLAAPAAAPEPEAARQELREVGLEYYANLRQIGRRGPFPTLAEARQAYPRCRTFDRRIFVSDGSSRWMEGVDDEMILLNEILNEVLAA